MRIFLYLLMVFTLFCAVHISAADAHTEGLIEKFNTWKKEALSSATLIEPPSTDSLSLSEEDQMILVRLYNAPKELEEKLDALGDDPDHLGRPVIWSIDSMVEALGEPISGTGEKSIKVSSPFIERIIERAEKLTQDWRLHQVFLGAQKDRAEDEASLARRINALTHIKNEGYENVELDTALGDLVAKQEVVLGAKREKEYKKKLKNEGAAALQRLFRGYNVRRHLRPKLIKELDQVGALLKEGEIDLARASLNTMKEKHKNLGAAVNQLLARPEQSVAKHEGARAFQALWRGRKVRKQLKQHLKDRLGRVSGYLESNLVYKARSSLDWVKEDYKGTGEAVDACLACFEHKVAKHEVAQEQAASAIAASFKTPDYRSRNMTMGIGGGSALVTVLAALWHRYQAATLRERIAQQLSVSSDTITADGIGQMLTDMYGDDRLAENEFETLSQAKELFLDHQQKTKSYAGVGIGLGLGTAVLASILHGRAAAAA